MKRIIRIIKKKKGFTLIELIVTIAVLGVLVLLASPRFFGHTQNAELTKGFANAKSIEKASEIYYMDHEDWPRLTDEPYTSEEIESYSEKIFDRTGQEVNLDPEGNYYDIDYDKLSNYVQVPDDKKNYILQNPVGKVFYMDNLNETGFARVDYSNSEKDENPIPIGEPMSFAYTGQPQNIELGKGTYKLEAWGAQGGSYDNNNYGGKGGYSKGLFELNEIRNVHIVVGGQGQGSYGPGGYNGGGMSGDEASDGGGASHIATVNGLLNSLSNNESSVILVAGGGGGSGRAKNGGYHGGPGGGLAGLSGIGHENIGTAGTQVAGGNVVSVNSTTLTNTTPGEFGQGGHIASHISFGSKAGGGGGYYGGGSGVAGGGGSSYIGGVQDGQTIPGDQSMPNPNGGKMVGNSGHGFARITRVR